MATKYVIKSKSNTLFLKKGVTSYTLRPNEALRFKTIGDAYKACSHLNDLIGAVAFVIQPTEK